MSDLGKDPKSPKRLKLFYFGLEQPAQGKEIALNNVAELETKIINNSQNETLTFTLSAEEMSQLIAPQVKEDNRPASLKAAIANIEFLMSQNLPLNESANAMLEKVLSKNEIQHLKDRAALKHIFKEIELLKDYYLKVSQKPYRIALIKDLVNTKNQLLAKLDRPDENPNLQEMLQTITFSLAEVKAKAKNDHRLNDGLFGLNAVGESRLVKAIQAIESRNQLQPLTAETQSQMAQKQRAELADNRPEKHTIWEVKSENIGQNKAWIFTEKQMSLENPLVDRLYMQFKKICKLSLEDQKRVDYILLKLNTKLNTNLTKKSDPITLLKEIDNLQKDINKSMGFLNREPLFYTEQLEIFRGIVQNFEKENRVSEPAVLLQQSEDIDPAEESKKRAENFLNFAQKLENELKLANATFLKNVCAAYPCSYASEAIQPLIALVDSKIIALKTAPPEIQAEMSKSLECMLKIHTAVLMLINYEKKQSEKWLRPYEDEKTDNLQKIVNIINNACNACKEGRYDVNLELAEISKLVQHSNSLKRGCFSFFTHTDLALPSTIESSP